MIIFVRKVHTYSYIAISIFFNVSSDLPPGLLILDHRELIILMVAS